MVEWMRTCLGAAVLCLAGSGMAQPLSRAPMPDMPMSALPPALPWSGASEALVVDQDDPWITPAERAGFATSPRYGEVQAWLKRLDAASPLISLEIFGRTGEGRDMLLVRASKGGGAKPVVLVQAGIHAGEIDGKDAILRNHQTVDRAMQALVSEAAGHGHFGEGCLGKQRGEGRGVQHRFRLIFRAGDHLGGVCAGQPL